MWLRGIWWKAFFIVLAILFLIFCKGWHVTYDIHVPKCIFWCSLKQKMINVFKKMKILFKNHIDFKSALLESMFIKYIYHDIEYLVYYIFDVITNDFLMHWKKELILLSYKSYFYACRLLLLYILVIFSFHVQTT